MEVGLRGLLRLIAIFSDFQLASSEVDQLVICTVTAPGVLLSARTNTAGYAHPAAALRVLKRCESSRLAELAKCRFCRARILMTIYGNDFLHREILTGVLLSHLRGKNEKYC